MVGDVCVEQGNVALKTTVGGYGREQRLGVETVDIGELIHIGVEVAPP